MPFCKDFSSGGRNTGLPHAATVCPQRKCALSKRAFDASNSVGGRYPHLEWLWSCWLEPWLPPGFTPNTRSGPPSIVTSTQPNQTITYMCRGSNLTELLPKLRYRRARARWQLNPEIRVSCTI